MGPSIRNITDRALKFLPIVQSIAEHYLCMIIRARFLKFGQLPEDIRRPLVTQELIDACLDENRYCDGVLPVIPVKDTIYMSHDGRHIDALLERNKLFAGQAPESFVFGKYLQAHRNMSDAKLEKINGSTEIAQMAGLNVHLIKGDSMNFKITTPDDLSTFETIVRDRNMKENR